MLAEAAAPPARSALPGPTTSLPVPGADATVPASDLYLGVSLNGQPTHLIVHFVVADGRFYASQDDLNDIGVATSRLRQPANALIALDALDGHVGVHYTSMNTGKARVWCFIDDGEPKTVAMKGAVSVNDADAYVAAVLAGLGLGKTSRYLVEPHPRTGALRRVPSRFDEPLRRAGAAGVDPPLCRIATCRTRCACSSNG